MEKLSNGHLNEAFDELRYATLTQQAKMPVRAHLEERKNPDPVQYKDRPALWNPGVDLTATPNTFVIASRDTYIWGHPRTLARFGLPNIPLEKGSLADEAVRSVTWKPGFPSEELKVLRQKNGDLSVETDGAHGQFNYEAMVTRDALDRARNLYSQTPVEGSGVIHMSQSALWLNSERRLDLEAQLLEGTFALGADLIDKLEHPESPMAWSALLQEIRGRVELRRQSMLSDTAPRGDLIPTGEAMLRRLGGF